MKIAAVLIAVYLGVYFILSISGDYVRTESSQSRLTPSGSTSVSEFYVWQPLLISCQCFHQDDGHWTLHANFLGYVFLPLVLGDQDFLHKTVQGLEEISS